MSGTETVVFADPLRIRDKTDPDRQATFDDQDRLRVADLTADQGAAGVEEWPVRDDYAGGQALASQAGAGDVLTFTFTSPVRLLWVRSVGGVSFADPFGGTPADGTGLYCADDEPHPITVTTSEVKVWAPNGATVHVWGYRR